MNVTKIITFASSKGGVGKSTLCINLAAYFSKAGASISVIDTDKQKSSYDWIGETSDKYLSKVQAVYLDDENKIEQYIASCEYDLVFLDLGGSVENSLAFGLAIADLIVVPCRPSRDDLIGLGWIVKLARDAADNFEDVNAHVFAVLNGINRNSLVYLHARQQIEEEGISLLGTSLSQTVAFSEANINRNSVLGTNSKASDLICNIGKELARELGLFA